MFLFKLTTKKKPIEELIRNPEETKQRRLTITKKEVLLKTFKTKTFGEGEKDNPPKPTAEIDYSKPVTMQPVSRLGFDVVRWN